MAECGVDDSCHSYTPFALPCHPLWHCHADSIFTGFALISRSVTFFDLNYTVILDLTMIYISFGILGLGNINCPFKWKVTLRLGQSV